MNNVLLSKSPNQDYYGGPIKIVGNAFDQATSGEPKDPNKPAIVRIKLDGLNAVRFKATLGGDYPLGNESQMRKTFAVRSMGTAARFLTLIEPHEGDSVIKSARAVSADKISCRLNSPMAGSS